MPNLLRAVQKLASLPTGEDIAVTMPYSSFEGMGVTVIVVTASISLACALILLLILGVSLYKRRYSPSEHFFVRTHASAYFTSLLVADIIQSIGSIMSAKWVKAGEVTLNNFCSAQGAIKNAGNLAISLWTLMLAVHTFAILFCRWKPKEWVLYATLIGVWLFVGFLVVIGPAAAQKAAKGPYFGVSGYWCWISDSYPVQRIALEYGWMFISAGLSFILYTLTFLRLRENIVNEGGKTRFCRIDSSNAWKSQVNRDSGDIQMTAVAKGMIGFPIMYTVIILPIAICRFVAWSGKSVPFEVTIFADAVFSLTGVFDLILFTTTRSLFPARGILPSWFLPRPKVPAEVIEHGVQPYNVQDFASAHGFNEKYQSQAERDMVTLPPRTSASLSRSSDAPHRPVRPLSLGEVAFVAPPIPPIPESPSPVRNNNRLTSKTVGSQYSQDSEPDYPTYAWDDVDLERSGSEKSSSPHRNSFGGDRSARDTQYTSFSLSAYEYSSERSPIPPMPSGAGIDLGAGRDHSDDEDDRHLMRPSNPAPDNRFSNGSSLYDLRSPEEVHYPGGRI